MSRWILVLGVWISGVVQAAPEQVPLYREIKDWVVACDNLRSCQALSAVENFSYPPLSLNLQRDAGATVPLKLFVRYAEGRGFSPLRSDGKPLATAAKLRLIERDGEKMLMAEGGDALVILDELRNAEQLSMKVESEHEAVTSLNGLSAALLLIDAVQGRVGTRSALQRPGIRPDSDVPAAPEAPRLHAYPGAVALEADEGRRIADAVMARIPDQDYEATPEAEVFALTEREALVIVRNWCAAYNCDFSVHRVSREPPYDERDLLLDPLPLGREGLSGWVSYQPDSGDLAYLYKGRATADCGDSARWRFDGERFQLVSSRLLIRCAGGSPGEWPELWRVAEP